MKPAAKEQFRAALLALSPLPKISAAQWDAFCQFYELVLKWNPILHLTTVISPLEFADRHIGETALALPHLLLSIRQLLDIGSGGGVPGVPLAILRPDLQVTLVESNKKKAIFLKEVAETLHLQNIEVLGQRFESLTDVRREVCLTSRALDGMKHLLPELVKLGAAGSQMLFWGNTELLGGCKINLPTGWGCHTFAIPDTHRRLLISLTRFT